MTAEGILEPAPIVSDREQRDHLFRTILHSIEAYRSLDQGAVTAEENASEVVRLSHLRDLLSLEIARRAGGLAQTDACVDWGSTSTVDWIRHKCKVSWGTAADWLNVGRELDTLPRSTEALESGTIGFAHLAIIARTAPTIRNSESAEPFDESILLNVAEQTSAGRFWYQVYHALHRADPQKVADDQRAAAEERFLEFTEGDDGWLFMKGAFDSISKATILTTFQALGQPTGEGDTRSRQRRHADVLLELTGHALDTGAVPQHTSVRPHVQVTTTLETLQGLIGAPAGEMALSLPISAKTVQRFACDSSITRVLLGADSAVIDAGREKRVVSGNMRRLLDSRDQHCRWPGCERPTSWTAAHHVRHWAQGGRTDLTNMVLLCQHHHWVVHEGGWRLTLGADGRVITIPPETEFVPSHLYPSDIDPASRAPDEFDAA